jgi:Tfp pilus assembly protein PilV
MNEKGQSLIEVMVALGVAVIIITAIVMSVILAVFNTQVAKTQNLATFYARQAMEILKQQSSSDWANFKNLSGPYCLAKGSTSLDPAKDKKTSGHCLEDSSNRFRREVVIVPPAQTQGNSCEIVDTGIYGSNIAVIVSWNDSKCADAATFCHQVKLESCFQDLNAIPTP